jgi:hypothetical protein
METRTTETQKQTLDTQQISPDLWEIREPLTRNYQQALGTLQSLNAESDVRTKREIIAEVRQNIALANRASQTILALEAAHVFEDAVIETLADTSPNLRREFIRRLNEREQTWRSRYERKPRPR